MKRILEIKWELLFCIIGTAITIYGSYIVCSLIDGQITITFVRSRIIQMLVSVAAVFIVHCGIKKLGTVRYCYSLENISIKNMLVGYMGAFAASLFVALIISTLTPLVDSELLTKSNIATDLASFDRAEIIAYLVVGGMVAPVAEEFLFRGVLFNAIEKISGMHRAAIISSLIFGLLHGISFATIANAIVIGLTLAYVYAADRNLLDCMIIHGMFNVLNIKRAVEADRSQVQRESSIVADQTMWELLQSMAVPIAATFVIMICVWAYYIRRAKLNVICTEEKEITTES